ncbi:DNA-(apurinic or apyrimidinic site) lyase [Candidatus Scalindua japonica]|uniref:DNA-(Apurinic or apyrimidinic site) lyase n=1 Tax=Candidatus Scalindua japonica TaxID=1284222 RepID=A0A286U272_9BACT|nr:endonuclease III [Candidatus Scalindua japonica]GAX62239.1 DNA-(apurinic or apyrimidinic site) lyase [Candidatus Scalindua japonica]
MEKIDDIVSVLKRENKKYVVPIVTIVSMTKGPFAVLVSCLLSLRTKDKVTGDASSRLFGLADNPEKMLDLSIKSIEKAIYPVGFYKTKAKRIKEICKVLLDDYGGVVPDEIDELLKLNGVGRKTANLVVTLGYGKLGICVDTHVHRISNRLGLVKTKTPEQTEFALRKTLPQKYWLIYNDLLVTYGQNLCVPISPWCSKCKIFKYCKRVGVEKCR